MPKRRTTRSQRRTAVRGLVERRDFHGLVSWYEREPDTAQRVIALIFDRNATTRWRALEAMGRLASVIASREGHEKVRGLIRRLLWLMNDESGGIAWHGPEAIAEILHHVPELVGEYGRIVASLIDEEPFGPGAHRAVARLAPIAPDEFAFIKDRLRVASDDPTERAYGLMGLAVLDEEAALLAANSLSDDFAVVTRFDRSTGELAQTTVAAIARRVLARHDHAA